MPKVTLLRPETKDYTIVRGTTSITFIGGQPKDVSVAVALTAKKILAKGKSLFKIEDVPELIQSCVQGQKNTRLVNQTTLFSVGA